MTSPTWLKFASVSSFVIERCGHPTAITVGPAPAVRPPVAVAEALLVTVPHDAAVVCDVMWTCLLVPLGIVPKLQVRTPTLIEQPLSEPPASIVQLNPGFAGSVSVTTTLTAVPGPLLF